MPAGGRGYTRVTSLISLWSTAPFLLNNSVGKFNPSPSVEARMQSFQDSIEQMLWPERRDQDLLLGTKVPGRIDRTTTRSFLRVPAGYLPEGLVKVFRAIQPIATELDAEGGLEIGPIPSGTPVNLLANLKLIPESDDFSERIEHLAKVGGLLIKVKQALKALPNDATDQQAAAALAPLVDPLLEFNKCPDLVVNRGHYFGTDYAKEEPGLSDTDKRALIEFLKTF
jgi:hypothetical protein